MGEFGVELSPVFHGGIRKTKTWNSSFSIRSSKVVRKTPTGSQTLTTSINNRRVLGLREKGVACSQIPLIGPRLILVDCGESCDCAVVLNFFIMAVIYPCFTKERARMVRSDRALIIGDGTMRNPWTFTPWPRESDYARLRH